MAAHRTLSLVGITASLCVILVLPRRADAGFEIGERVTYAIPKGDLAEGSGNELSTVFDARIFPIWIDLGYRTDVGTFYGAYFQYNTARIASDYKNLATAAFASQRVGTPNSFSGNDIRVGFQLNHRFLNQRLFGPHLGFGVGYEWANTSFKSTPPGSQTADLEIDFHGFETFFEFGLEFTVSKISLGPFAVATLGRYSTMAVGVSGPGRATVSDSKSIDNTAIHSWLQFGLKARLTL
jgi:hypothetical protein